MKQRIHLNLNTETGIRTIFFVDSNNNQAIDIRENTNISTIINKKDYVASHQYMISNPDISFIIYPSCRDPKQRDNAAILNILHLEKNPKWESAIKFFYDNTQKKITWLDYQLHIQWAEVA